MASKNYPHMNRAKQKAHQAFLDDIKAVEKKHGLHLVVMQPQPELRVEELKGEEEQ